MKDAAEIHAYLLGTLSPERIEQIEQRILTDDSFHEEVEIMEEELLDRYIQEGIIGEERLLFERNFLASPVRKQKLAFARALQTRINSSKNAPASITARFSSLYPYALATCILAVAALGLASYRLSTQLQQQRNQTSQLMQQLEEIRKNPVLASSGQNLASQPLLVAKLLPERSREGGLYKISVPDGIRAVQFALQIPKNVQGEMVIELLNDSGGVITTIHHVQLQKVENQAVAIATITTDHLKPGNYFLRATSSADSSIHFQYPIQIRH